MPLSAIETFSLHFPETWKVNLLPRWLFNPSVARHKFDKQIVKPDRKMTLTYHMLGSVKPAEPTPAVCGKDKVWALGLSHGCCWVFDAR